MNPINSSPRKGHARPRHVLLAVTVGNMLEWYDFAVYGFLTPVIAKIMFPAADPTASLLLSVGAFGVGFLTRPVGALVFGALADRKGRKLALLLTFGLMGIATFAIGLIPTIRRHRRSRAAARGSRATAAGARDRRCGGRRNRNVD